VRRAAAAAPPLLAFLAFLPSLRGEFLSWDDRGNLAHVPAGLWDAFASTHYGHFQPLPWLSLALDKALWGLDPRGYHLTNLLLHSLAAFLLYLVIKELLKESQESVLCASLAATLWAVHPLRVEPVAWITERRELLATAFLLGSMRWYARGRKDLALLAFFGASLSKVTTAVFPAVLVAYDFWQGRALRDSLKEKVPHLTISAAVLALGIRAQTISGTAVPLSLFSVSDRLAQASFGPGYYAVKSLWPFDLNPFVYVDWRAEAARHLSYAVLVVPFSVSLWFNRRRRWFVSLSAAVLLFLLPSLGFFKSGPQTAADRFAHMASLPVAVAVAFVLARSRRSRLVALAAVLLMAPLTWTQCAVWRDSVSLWRAAYERSPRPTPLVLQNLAAALRESGREEEAAALFARLSAEAPDSPAAFALKGEAAFEAGDYAAAEAAFAAALARNPDMPGVRVNHGLALYKLGRHGEAEEAFAGAAALAPDNADAWHNLGLCLARRGAPQAQAALERALALSPGRPDTLRVLALLRGAK
jgi:tetratricopeptide (TPR) repeat protein